MLSNNWKLTMNNITLTKRHLLGGIALASSAALLAACNGKDENKEAPPRRKAGHR